MPCSAPNRDGPLNLYWQSLNVYTSVCRRPEILLRSFVSRERAPPPNRSIREATFEVAVTSPVVCADRDAPLAIATLLPGDGAAADFAAAADLADLAFVALRKLFTLEVTTPAPPAFVFPVVPSSLFFTLVGVRSGLAALPSDDLGDAKPLPLPFFFGRPNREVTRDIAPLSLGLTGVFGLVALLLPAAAAAAVRAPVGVIFVFFAAFGSATAAVAMLAASSSTKWTPGAETSTAANTAAALRRGLGSGCRVLLRGLFRGRELSNADNLCCTEVETRCLPAPLLAAPAAAAAAGEELFDELGFDAGDLEEGEWCTVAEDAAEDDDDDDDVDDDDVDAVVSLPHTSLLFLFSFSSAESWLLPASERTFLLRTIPPPLVGCNGTSFRISLLLRFAFSCAAAFAVCLRGPRVNVYFGGGLLTIGRFAGIGEALRNRAFALEAGDSKLAAITFLLGFVEIAGRGDAAGVPPRVSFIAAAIPRVSFIAAAAAIAAFDFGYAGGGFCSCDLATGAGTAAFSSSAWPHAFTLSVSDDTGSAGAGTFVTFEAGAMLALTTTDGDVDLVAVAVAAVAAVAARVVRYLIFDGST